MKIEFFNHTLEVYFYKNEYGQNFARKLLARSLSSFGGSGKIPLIKTLRIQEDLTLVEAKKIIEEMFDFDSAGNGIVK